MIIHTIILILGSNMFKIDSYQPIQAARQNRVEIYEDILDFTQMKVLPPLVFCCLFLTVFLLCQYFDGSLRIPIWACFIPAFSMILYAAPSVFIIKIIYKHQFMSDSLLKGLYGNLDSMLKLLLFREGQQPRQIRQTMYGYSYVCMYVWYV